MQLKYRIKNWLDERFWRFKWYRQMDLNLPRWRYSIYEYFHPYMVVVADSFYDKEGEDVVQFLSFLRNEDYDKTGDLSIHLTGKTDRCLRFMTYRGAKKALCRLEARYNKIEAVVCKIR